MMRPHPEAIRPATKWTRPRILLAVFSNRHPFQLHVALDQRQQVIVSQCVTQIGHFI
jgi:hypothetical protein